MSQIGSSPQVGVKMKKYLKPHVLETTTKFLSLLRKELPRFVNLELDASRLPPFKLTPSYPWNSDWFMTGSIKHGLSRWWLFPHPSEKYLWNWIISPSMGENKNCLKPQLSLFIRIPIYKTGLFFIPYTRQKKQGLGHCSCFRVVTCLLTLLIPNSPKPG